MQEIIYDKPVSISLKEMAEIVSSLFPGEIWEHWWKTVYYPRSRLPKNDEQTKVFNSELYCAAVWANYGFTVCLLPEKKTTTGKKADALVGGVLMEFKHCTGSYITIKKRFLEAREQAHNVTFIIENEEIDLETLWQKLAGVIMEKGMSGGSISIIIPNRYFQYNQVDCLKRSMST